MPRARCWEHQRRAVGQPNHSVPFVSGGNTLPFLSNSSQCVRLTTVGRCLSAAAGVAARGLETDADEGFISIFDGNSLHE